MVANSFLQLAVLAAAGLPRLVAAGADPSPVYDPVGQQPINPPIAVANASTSSVEGEILLDECDTSITACATTADVKVVRTHKSTQYVTNFHTFESISTLTPSTRTVTQVVVSTRTTSVEGQCRETIIYEEPTPLIITVDVNTTVVRDFVPIVPTTVTTVSWVEHKQTSQCIIRKTSTGLAAGPGSSSATPAPSAPPPSQPNPPAAGSPEADPSSPGGQPASGSSSAKPSSARGTGRPREPRQRRASSSSRSSASASPSGSGSVSGASGASSSASSQGSQSTP
ncbi:hypothetical protein NLU13_7616 [Sarocladium strictum]|uniref:Uncharacterized protein n=1 Tax=Sarocladium strictum TaxID=5046 RepID=A0AA39GEB2_SARSR|nr:hypothetical protein NLU13_7616 [Sarocladium strictum]